MVEKKICGLHLPGRNPFPFLQDYDGWFGLNTSFDTQSNWTLIFLEFYPFLQGRFVADHSFSSASFVFGFLCTASNRLAFRRHLSILLWRFTAVHSFSLVVLVLGFILHCLCKLVGMQRDARN